MDPNPNGRQGNRKKRWLYSAEPSKMLTRQGRNSSDMEDEKIVSALKAAGIDGVDDMSEDDKRNTFFAIQSSMVVVSNEREEFYERSSTGSPSNIPGQSPDPEIYEAQTLNSDIVMEENVVRPNRPVDSGTNPLTKSAGRGRGKPVKTKYPSLPINSSPGQKSDSSFSPSIGSKANTSLNLVSPVCSRSPTIAPRSESTPSMLTRNLPKTTDDTAALSDPSSPLSPESQSCIQTTPEIFKQSSSSDSVETPRETLQADDDVLVDVESGPPEEGAVCDSEPDSPASIQDIGEDEKEPVKTVLLGNIAAQVSPLESMNRGLPHDGFGNFLQQLEKYRGNKAEWMAKAKEMVKEQHIAISKKLKEDNPIWGPPITDGGNFNQRTLFMDSTPKYSQLFSNSSEKQAGTSTTGRAERQSKTKAVSKIQEALTEPDLDEPEYNESKEPEFHSLRRSRYNDGRNQDTGNRQSSNPWNRKQQDVVINDDSCREDTQSVAGVDKWPSSRLEQRGKSADGDFEMPPEPAKVSSSADVYTYDEEEEIWEKPLNRTRKNNKKGGKPDQADVELEAKMSSRQRGAGASQQIQRKNTKLRLQKGTIAHPSQHVQNQRHKGGFSAQMEGDTNARNSANTEGRWLTTDTPGEIENTPEISSKNFYPKNVKPRNSPNQPRRPRDGARPDDFSSPPSTSVDISATMQCPICGKSFSSDKIEAHASDCTSEEAPAVGEMLQSDDQDSEEPNKAVEGVKNVETIQEDKVEELSYHCKLCDNVFTHNEMKGHLEECIKFNCTPSKKRANSIDDDGPVKKTRMFD